MSFNMSSNWNQNNWDRRGRGGRGRGGRGFNRGNRGSWGRDNFRTPQPYGNQGGFWSGNWNQDNFHGPGNRNINQQWKKMPSRDTPGKRLSEDEIGVVEYVNDHKGFSGIIKSRYSDFQVSEINEKGEVAKLTDMTPPPTPIDDTVEEDEDLLFSKYNLEILPMATWDSINKLVVTQEDPTGKVEIDVTGMSKEQRTKIHDAVKKAFGESVVGSTVTINEKKIVCFEKYRKGVRIDNRVKWMWPGEYVYFIVHKENCDTMDAALRITERLRINMKVAMLGYAGTKDRRAKTSQWFSIRRVDPRRLASATAGLRNIRLGNYSFAETPLRLGLLKGNQFRIALRNVTAADECVAEACELLRSGGFLNYYGLQRFGTRADTPTYSIGLKLLQCKYQEALDSIMAEQAMEPGVRRSGPELRVKRVLARSPNDLQGALQQVPRNTRLLYLHAYQSLVWNRCVTERVRRAGLAPAAGDLAALRPPAHEDLCDDDSEDEDVSEKEDEDGSEKEAKSEADGQLGVDKGKERRGQNKDVPKPKLPVKVLTQEDVDSGRFTIFDIVMPLPGSSVEYPPNMKDYYEELLTKDGLELTMTHKMRAYCMSGAYRAVVCRPLAMRWQHVRYTDPHKDLIRSDWDELSQGPAPAAPTDGKFKALLLTLSLPASCYATMALRELLKADTAGDAQAKLNHYYKPEAAEAGTQPSDGNGDNGEKRKLDDNGDVDNGDVDAKKAKTGDDGGQ